MLYLNIPSEALPGLSDVAPVGISMAPVLLVRGAIASKLSSISVYVNADPLSLRLVIAI